MEEGRVQRGPALNSSKPVLVSIGLNVIIKSQLLLHLSRQLKLHRARLKDFIIYLFYFQIIYIWGELVLITIINTMMLIQRIYCFYSWK